MGRTIPLITKTNSFISQFGSQPDPCMKVQRPGGGGLNSLCLLKYQDGIQMSPSCTIVKKTYTGNADGEKTKRTKREASCAFIQALSAVKQCTCNLHIFFSTTRASELGRDRMQRHSRIAAIYLSTCRNCSVTHLETVG